MPVSSPPKRLYRVKTQSPAVAARTSGLSFRPPALPRLPKQAVRCAVVPTRKKRSATAPGCYLA